MYKYIAFGAVAALLAATDLASAQQPSSTAPTNGVTPLLGGSFSLAAGVDYSTGKYGQSSTTDILYLPVTGRYDIDKWTVKLTVPYISVTGPGNVVRGIGVVGNKAAGPRRTEEGLGDVIAGVTRNVYDGASTGTLVDLTGKIKFGTADAGKGLGTGENDYAAQVDLTQRVTPVITAFGSVGYKIIGNPAGAALHNVFYGEVGGSYKITDALYAGLIFDASQAPSISGAQRELTAYVGEKISDRWRVQGYVVHGFANGSPDWAAGGMVSYRF